MPGSRYEVDRVAVGVWDRDTIHVSKKHAKHEYPDNESAIAQAYSQSVRPSRSESAWLASVVILRYQSMALVGSQIG